MAEERSRGLILRTRPLTETSLIVQWLTPELGRIATVAKGARRPKSPFRGKLDLFYAGEFSFLRSRRSDLHTLREVVLHETHPALRRDMGRLQQACYASTLIELATEQGTPLEEPHRLLAQLLHRLNLAPADAAHLLAFEARLLAELGFSPASGPSPLTPGARQILGGLLGLDWSSLPVLKPGPGQLVELKQHLASCLLQSLDRIPRGRAGAFRLGVEESTGRSPESPGGASSPA